MKGELCRFDRCPDYQQPDAAHQRHAFSRTGACQLLEQRGEVQSLAFQVDQHRSDQQTEVTGSTDDELIPGSPSSRGSFTVEQEQMMQPQTGKCPGGYEQQQIPWKAFKKDKR